MPARTAASLEAELAARWPGAEGQHRAITDETHRLVLLHPLYDGFVSLEVTARCDLDGVFVVPDVDLVDIITSHHRTGPVERGQTLPIDLELHPRNVRSPASTGLLELVDASGDPIATPVRITLATSFKVECELAGGDEGTFGEPAVFEQHARALVDGRTSPTRLARGIRRVQAGRRWPTWWMR